MAEQGHGSHWECVENIEIVLQKLSSMIQEGSVVVTSEVVANCFDNGTPSVTRIFSISDEFEITSKHLIAVNQERASNELVTGYPFINLKNRIKLKITEINEWDNLIEAIITGETEGGHTISFFDTDYFLNKETYKIGEIYDFSISALGYNVEILKENSFSLVGQKAIDWYANIGQEPSCDENGNVEPVVIYLNTLVACLPISEDYPEDVEFQSPIIDIETIRAFDKDFYKFKIMIARDPDIEIYLYAKNEFFDREPKVDDAIRGIMWLQGKKE